MAAPALAVGDGALGFWAALREVWPPELPVLVDRGLADRLFG